jgi:transcriptional pleiotropic regulator of transition state genes
MKSTGILKSVDELGRIVLPKKMRENLDIEIRDQVELFVEGDRIILKKYMPTCIFCDSEQNIVIFNGKRVCGDCLKSLKSMA